MGSGERDTHGRKSEREIDIDIDIDIERLESLAKASADARVLPVRFLFLIQHLDRLQNHATHDLQAGWAELVNRVLRGVVEDVAVTIVQVNQVGARHPSFMNGR